ncbi:hypothetical protein DZB84_04540 [Bacillus sp. HNG]|uniref:hypothetical protein n=1 Tax=Bacillus sp. HNG TaxID=2293325 RepID=UPI000E2F7195|nr:hypothetical protein [Bacillus sp. HNG]RFB18189.1 hypothetical protein DZB84_04540 [Bacillus sp. HNG]
MNRNSRDPVILQQKIIHLQSELSKYKSIKKEKLLFENQKLRELINQLRSENELLKQQFVSSNMDEAKQKRSTEPIKKVEKSRTESKPVGLENGWFFHNLIHEKKKK